ncbi:hypothetical protein D3C76_1670260 [compost metagenome]
MTNSPTANPAIAICTIPTDRPTPASAASKPAYTNRTTFRPLPRSSNTPPKSEPIAPPMLNNICTMPAWGLVKPCANNSEGNQLSSMYITVRVKK